MRYPHSRFKLRATTLAVITVLGGFTLSGSAAETTLKDTVVSATLSEHETRTAPASVIVITRQELETRNATDLLDAVRGSLGTTLSPRQVGGTGRTIKLTEAQSLDVQWSQGEGIRTCDDVSTTTTYENRYDFDDGGQGCDQPVDLR